MEESQGHAVQLSGSSWTCFTPFFRFKSLTKKIHESCMSLHMPSLVVVVPLAGTAHWNNCQWPLEPIGWHRPLEPIDWAIASATQCQWWWRHCNAALPVWQCHPVPSAVPVVVAQLHCQWEWFGVWTQLVRILEAIASGEL